MSNCNITLVNNVLNNILPKLNDVNKDSNNIIMIHNNNLYITHKRYRLYGTSHKYINSKYINNFNWSEIENGSYMTTLGEYEIFYSTRGIPTYYIGKVGCDLYYIHYDAIEYLFKTIIERCFNNTNNVIISKVIRYISLILPFYYYS